MEKEWSYKDVFAELRKINMIPPRIHKIFETIQVNGFNREALDKTLLQQGIDKVSLLREELLDLLLLYVAVILNDHAISDKEYEEFGLLKLLFKIQEGDFFNKRYYQIKIHIFKHLEYIFQDGKISVGEAFTTAKLQSMFSLTAEQYFKIQEEYKASKLFQS